MPIVRQGLVALVLCGVVPGDDTATTNDGDDSVFVLGTGLRYNLETVMLDPLVVGTLMLDRNLYPPTEFGLDKDFVASQLKSCDNTLTKLLPKQFSSNVVCAYEG